jgi:hypothetical protein
VIACETTADINATLAVAGHISGTVTEADGVGLADVYVAAYRASSSGARGFVNTTWTADGGSYDLGGLPTDRHRIESYDASGTYVRECYGNKSDIGSAAPVAMIAGQTTSGPSRRLRPAA